jgi:hypothetical protein
MFRERLTQGSNISAPTPSILSRVSEKRGERLVNNRGLQGKGRLYLLYFR